MTMGRRFGRAPDRKITFVMVGRPDGFCLRWGLDSGRQNAEAPGLRHWLSEHCPNGDGGVSRWEGCAPAGGTLAEEMGGEGVGVHSVVSPGERDRDVCGPEEKGGARQTERAMERLADHRCCWKGGGFPSRGSRPAHVLEPAVWAGWYCTRMTRAAPAAGAPRPVVPPRAGPRSRRCLSVGRPRTRFRGCRSCRAAGRKYGRPPRFGASMS